MRKTTNHPWKGLMGNWKSWLVAAVIAALLVGALGETRKNIFWTTIWIYLTIEAWKYWRWKALIPYPLYILSVMIAGSIIAGVGVGYSFHATLIVLVAFNLGGLAAFYILLSKTYKDATISSGVTASETEKQGYTTVISDNQDLSSRTLPSKIYETDQRVSPIPPTMKHDMAELRDSIATETKSMNKPVSSDEDFYEKAFNELESGGRKVGLWAKAFAEAEGNESLAKANYLKVRAGQLASEYEKHLMQERERQNELIRQQETLAMETQRQEQERQEAEKMAAIEADRIKLEGTRKEIARDGRFIAYDNGTVLDTKTNLMWADTDNASNINWPDAKSYCEDYRGGGYTDWRMPTEHELARLYDSAKTYKTDSGYEVHLTELIHLTFPSPWTSETRGYEAAVFNLSTGKGFWDVQDYDFDGRILPVRSTK